MTTHQLDAIRQGVLDRMERHERNMRLAIAGAAIIELGLLATLLLLVDWGDRTQTIVVITALLSYTIVALGFVALGAHVSRTIGRVLLAIDSEPAR